MEFTCPVCFYNGLYAPPYDRRGVPSDEICPCCGFHFGYDDLGPDKDIYSKWRLKWIEGGRTWFSRSRMPPENWDPEL